MKKPLLLLILFHLPLLIIAQEAINKSLLSQPGIFITILLVMIPVLLSTIFASVKNNNAVKVYYNRKRKIEAALLAQQMRNRGDSQLELELEIQQKALQFELSNKELAGSERPEDIKAIVQNISTEQEVHFTAVKMKAAPRPGLSPDISRLILWYLGCSIFWLVLGGTIGEYMGIKFVAPELDSSSWLSIGHLRSVHTNMVFWGWASLGIIGLGYYVVPTVSNSKIFRISWGWIWLILINAMVILGSLSLMAGINNGGSEFREYIWPITSLFAVALILTLANFLMTVARKTTKEIYISNWYIIFAIIFTIIIALTAYLPFWQNGLGKTIIQGYYMHVGVGMWFTLFTLGLLYYFIPQQLNRPIYAYANGIFDQAAGSVRHWIPYRPGAGICGLN